MTLEYQNLSGAPSRGGMTAYGVISVIIGAVMILGGICTASMMMAIAPRAGTTVTYTSTGTVVTGPTTVPSGAVAVAPTTMTGQVTTTNSRGVVTMDYASSSITGGPTTSSTIAVATAGGATTMPAGGMVLPGMTRGAAAITAVGAGVFFVGGGALALLFGVAMLRARPWVRPWVVALSGLAWITVVASIPNTIMVISQQMIPGNVAAWSIYLGVGISFLFNLGIPLAYFIYFARARVEAVTRYYNPGPTWTDRWPLGVFCVMVAALFQVVASVASGAFMVANGDFSGGAMVMLLSAGVQGVISGVVLVLCYRRSKWAFAGAWVSLGMQAAGLLASLATGYQPQMKEFATSFPGAAAPTMSAAMLVVPVAFGVALLFCQRQARRWEPQM